MNSQLPLDTLGKTIVACIDKGDKAIQFYKAAGIHLAEAKVRVKNDKMLTWGKFLRVHCNNLSVRRANEYIAIGDGRVKVSDMRERAAKGMKKTRVETKGKSQLNGRNVTPKRSELPNEIKTSVSSGDITEADIGANLWMATRAIDLFEGAPDWKKVKKELTKKELDTLVSAIEELKNV